MVITFHGAVHRSGDRAEGLRDVSIARLHNADGDANNRMSAATLSVDRRERTFPPCLGVQNILRVLRRGLREQIGFSEVPTVAECNQILLFHVRGHENNPTGGGWAVAVEICVIMAVYVFSNLWLL